VSVAAARTVTAVFAPQVAGGYTLTVAKAGNGTGTVSASGFTCDAGCSGAVAQLPAGTSVTLTATAATGGSTFGGWSGCNSSSGATCTVAMSASKTVTATFTNPVTGVVLTVAKAGPGSGTVTSTPAGINCGSTCSETVSSGAAVVLRAAEASGSRFMGWSGCDSVKVPASGGNAECWMVMSSGKGVTASFGPQTPQTFTLKAIDSNLCSTKSSDASVASNVYPNRYPKVGQFVDYIFVAITFYQEIQKYGAAIKFDVASLAGKTIDSAVLNLTTTRVGGGSGTSDFQIAAVADAWDPTTITWNSWGRASLHIESGQRLTRPSSVGQTYAIQIASTVQNWVNGTWANDGLTIMSTSYADLNPIWTLDATYSFDMPTLTITYH
jgi:hypothetical protein